MAKFVKLTAVGRGYADAETLYPTWINIDTVTDITVFDDGADGKPTKTNLSRNGYMTVVRETPEQILSLIEEATKP